MDLSTTHIIVIIHILIEVPVGLRAMLRPHREPASRIAWLAVIAGLPIIGSLAYLFLGEVNIGHRQIARMREVMKRLPDMGSATDAEAKNLEADIPEHYQRLFQLGKSISGFEPVGGNSAKLLKDSNATIDAIVEDIDDAKDHVHLLFYIWLEDNNGLKIVESLKRAAKRGVTCRAIADSLGSRAMVRSEHWQAMKEAGVLLAEALPLGRSILRPFRGRLDLRNHRKIVVIDDTITYCGSQNCADPEFRVKAKYAPWVDIMLRFEGPVARQNQHVFASDWMVHSDEDINGLLEQPVAAPRPGFSAQVVGSGPTVRTCAMPEMFESLIYTAFSELVISTPYYVPDEAMQCALCSAAYRGVPTTLILPARNDSWIVGGASRSYYPDLLEAGVSIYEYEGGLLHAKTLTIDGKVCLIGSANMDRRSFELNYENNILLSDPATTAAIRERQQDYISQSHLVAPQAVASWSAPYRLWNNTLALLGPVL